MILLEIRYDNLPLYIEENKGKKEGKIGLIDLQYMEKELSPKGLATLVRIFPLHIDVIQEEAQKLSMLVEYSSLAAEAEKGKKYIKICFLDHVQWLEQRNISNEVAAQNFQIDSKRTGKLKSFIERDLLKLNQGDNDLYVRRRYPFAPLKDFLKGDENKIAKEITADITSVIVQNIEYQIKQSRDRALKTVKRQQLTQVELCQPLVSHNKTF